MIYLKCFNKKQLEEFVRSGNFAAYDFLPITKHRALSQIKNPRAAENDVLLTLAFEEEKLAGYLGTFPDEFEMDGKSYKFAWLSTLFVSTNFRGKKVAQQLLEQVFEKYEGKIAITEFTKEAEKLYNKTQKFEYIPPKIGKRFYFRTDFQTLVPRRRPQLKVLKPGLKTIDFLSNSAIAVQSKFTKTKKVHFEICETIDEESENFINHFLKNRNAENLRWILQNPWVLEGNIPEEKYLFSSYCKEFKYTWVKIFNEKEELMTCALLQARDQNLKIPYLFSKNDLGGFIDFLENFIKEKKIKTLISYHSELNENLYSNQFPKIHQKKAERKYLFHEELLKKLPENFDPQFQDGDGDPVFT